MSYSSDGTRVSGSGYGICNTRGTSRTLGTSSSGGTNRAGFSWNTSSSGGTDWTSGTGNQGNWLDGQGTVGDLLGTDEGIRVVDLLSVNNGEARDYSFVHA